MPVVNMIFTFYSYSCAVHPESVVGCLFGCSVVIHQRWRVEYFNRIDYFFVVQNSNE